MKDDPDRFVLDASVTLNWLFEDEESEYADSVLERLKTATAIAPAVHWELEVANGLLMAQRRGRLSVQELRRASANLQRLGVVFALPGHGLELVELYQKHRLTSYDAAYLSIAVTLGLPLAALDQNLRRAARIEGTEVVAPP